MPHFTGRLLGAAFAAVLVAGCSSSGGGDDPNSVYGSGSVTGSSSATGTALGGAKTSARNGKTSTATNGTSTAHHGGSTGGDDHGGGGDDHGGGGGTGGGGGGGGTPTGTTTHTPPASNCVQSTSAGAHITVCPGKSLSDGQTVTITGDHFKANENLLYMQCHYKGEDANNYGPGDCNINIVQLGPNSTKSDASGKVGPLQLTVKAKYKNVNCLTGQCMITVAVPIQNDTADNPHALIDF